MPTTTSQLRLEATGSDKTAQMFNAVKGQLEQTAKKIQQVSQPAVNAKESINGAAGALQNLAAMAGGGKVASAIGQAKGLSNALQQLGVSAAKAGPAGAVIAGVVAMVAIAYSRVKKAQDAAKKSAEELREAQEKNARAVVAAYEKAIAKVKELRSAQDALRAAQRERSQIADAAWETKLETEGLRRMLAATTEDEREAIAREVAEAIAGARHDAAIRTASDAVEDARRELRRNEADISKRQQELVAARRIGATKEEIQKITDAIEAAERRRDALNQRVMNANERRRQVEAEWRKEQLARQLEAQREVEEAAEEAAEKQARLEERLADIRKRRAEEIAKAEQKARETTERWFQDAMKSRVQANMAGAGVMDASSVARAMALTGGPHAQFRRVAGGLAMTGAGISKEDQERMKQDRYRKEVTTLLSDINRKFDEQESAASEGEI